MPNGCIDSWTDLRERFAERFSLRRKCSKDPTEVSKIIRRANETLPDFKERWTEEMSYIQGVPEVMQISSFMSNSMCPKLARCFANQSCRRGNTQRRGKEHHIRETGHLARVMEADTKGRTTTTPTVLGTTISHVFLHGHTTGGMITEGMIIEV
ncbi:hypothetical protein Tco_0016614 [Tanacetum coccineum]